MRHQAVRAFALMLGVLLAAAAPARAGSITFAELARTVGASGQLRPASEVRLRFGARGYAGQEQGGQTQSGPAANNGNSSPDQQPAAGSQQTTAPAAADPTLSQSGGRVETVDLGDVTGTVCDCGEIPPPPPVRGGGFPWWPLLGGALIPLFIPRGDENPPETGPTPPKPPETPIPEPMSLLLFGTGLLAAGAGARRRRARKLLEGSTLNATTEEV